MTLQFPMTVEDDEPDRQEGDADKEWIAKGCGSRRQEAEGRAGIEDVNDREEVGDDGDAVAQGDRGLNKQLRCLIEQDDDQGDGIEMHCLVRGAGCGVRRAWIGRVRGARCEVRGARFTNGSFFALGSIL